MHQNKPSGLINKRIDINNFNNNNNVYNNSNNYKIYNLSKFSQNKKSNDLLAKITEKITKEKFKPKKIKLNTKFFLENNENDDYNKSPSNPSSLKSLSNSSEKKEKESNEDEDDILSEQKDKIEEGVSNLLSMNKVDSINIHSNFIPTHKYSNSGFSINSNTPNSNNSSMKDRSNTEPNNQNVFKQRIYHPMSVMYPFKRSFLSTNTNSHNQSGHKIDSSLSNESGLSNYQSMQFNHTMNNFRNNNNNFCFFPFVSNVTPIGNNRHIYTSSFNSNENLFNSINNNSKPFSKNKSNCNNNNKNDNNINSNNNSGNNTGKEIINLEDVALGKETRTTIMIRNIPIKYDTNVLLKELEPFEGKFNCLYMPYDYFKDGNKGYAFLNLTNPYHILLFYDYFYNKSWLFFDSKKICELNYAKSQGTEAIKAKAKIYKDIKKTLFFISTNDDNINNTIEIPMKYLKLLLKANPKMKFHEIKFKNTFIVDSFN